MTPPERTIVAWIPDWPIRAHLADLSMEGSPPSAPTAAIVALVSQHRVVACSARARRSGVRIGMRERDAQSLHPDLTVSPHTPEVDERRFAPVITALAEVIPGIEYTRPGVCVVRARGPARFYGSEGHAAAALRNACAALGFPEVRIGIADGRFAAELVARASPADPEVCAGLDPRTHTPLDPGVQLILPGQTRSFLSPLPIGRAAEPALARTLSGLGISTLGAFAALPEAAVRARFGMAGVSAHRRALGEDLPALRSTELHTPAPDLSVSLSLDHPINTADQLAFACATLTDTCLAGLHSQRLVCTALRIELSDDTGLRHEKEWAHPHRFTAADLLNRIRWQAHTFPYPPGRTESGITEVRITPTHTDHAAAHEPGLWSLEPDARIHHHLSRIQNLIGHTGVGSVELSGGRLLRDRQRLVPWGTRAPSGRSQSARTSAPASPRSGPWPGALPPPHPTIVFPLPPSAEFHDAAGLPVGVDADDLLSSTPHWVNAPEVRTTGEVSRWSFPWPIRERWWSGAPARFRVQVLLTDGTAMILITTGTDLLSAPEWAIEGIY